MDPKLREFLRVFCLNEHISHQSRVDRTYAVLQYVVEEGKMTAEEATKILDAVKEGNYGIDY